MSNLPSFLIKRVPKYKNKLKIRQLLDDPSLYTVCESASCPNLGECFSKKVLTFMILGNVCTRDCFFCGVEKGLPNQPNPNETENIAKAVEKLNLEYVVVTSVNRDDLPDYGASQFVKVIKRLYPLPVEVLIPDLKGDWNQLKKIVDAAPFCVNHNIETVPRLYNSVRPQANYALSLELVGKVKELNPDVYTKSGIMVGLGESDDEVIEALHDLKSANCDIVTIGQYLPPSKKHLEVKRFVEPETFARYKEIGENSLGFLSVSSGPFVRSSYKAGNAFKKNRRAFALKRMI